MVPIHPGRILRRELDGGKELSGSLVWTTGAKGFVRKDDHEAGGEHRAEVAQRQRELGFYHQGPNFLACTLPQERLSDGGSSRRDEELSLGREAEAPPRG